MVMCSRGTSLGLRMALNRRKVHCTVDDLHRSFAAFCLREKELIREEKKVTEGFQSSLIFSLRLTPQAPREIET